MSRGRHLPPALAALLALPASAADGPPPLQRDPFALPADQATGRVGSPGAALSLPPEDLELHAVMPGSVANALVSLNGLILGIGDSYAGNTLVEVGHDAARFTRDNGPPFILRLRPLQPGPGGDPGLLQEDTDATATPGQPAPDNPEEQPVDTNEQAP